MDYSKICKGLQITDNKTCSEIQTKEGFQNVLPSDIQKCIKHLKCDQSWRLQDGRLIADPSDPQTWTDPAKAVKSDRLVTSGCVDLTHEFICHSDDGTPFIRNTTFRVRNQTAVTPNSVTPDRQSSDQLWGLLALLFIPVLILILIYLIRRKMIPRSVQRGQCDDDDSEDRDHEADVQEKLRFDSPDSRDGK